jgi:hypothetical protein
VSTRNALRLRKGACSTKPLHDDDVAPVALLISQLAAKTVRSQSVALPLLLPSSTRVRLSHGIIRQVSTASPVSEADWQKVKRLVDAAVHPAPPSATPTLSR